MYIHIIHPVPQSQGQQKPGVVIPMGPQPVQPSPQSMQNIQIKPVGKSPSTIQIRQEGGEGPFFVSYPDELNYWLLEWVQLSCKFLSTENSDQNHKWTLISNNFIGMKIITQSFPGSSGSKILPKPSALSTSSGTPVVVVSPGSSTASSVTMMTKPITSIGKALWHWKHSIAGIFYCYETT